MDFVWLPDYSLITLRLSSTPLDSFRTQPVNEFLVSLEIIFTGICMVVLSIHLSCVGLQHSALKFQHLDYFPQTRHTAIHATNCQTSN